ncbi:MAG: biotin synthase auxiliary protein BsaP [Acidimicrobiales bacterium]
MTGAGRYCTGCGSNSCRGCGRILDPPRFCPECGSRMTVAVSPLAFRAICRQHGQISME